MLKIQHKGIQASIDLNQTGFTGDVAEDSKLAYVQSLKAGRLIAVTPDGAALADGDPAEDATAIGFLINDAEGYFYENKPALASGKVAITVGNCVVVTDQIDTAETFAPGDALYAGTGAKAGLVTKTPITDANTAPTVVSRQIGIALSAASSASPELTIAVL